MRYAVGMNSVACRGRILYFVESPRKAGRDAWRYLEDGLLWIEDGYVREVGEYSLLAGRIPDSLPLRNYSDHLIIPGFVDTHTHFPQIEMIGAFGAQLLDWLQTYTFPTEKKFSNEHYASGIAERFLTELLRNGTTTAMVFGTVHPQSVDAFFKSAQQRSLRMIAGKVLMDRNAPDYLCDTAEQGYAESRELIRRWHGVDRLQYAVTPRFAPSSSPHQLELAGQLLTEFPSVYLQTHIAETRAEVDWVGRLFPQASNYVDVYQQHGLLRKRSILAHGVHLQDDECRRLAEADATLAHCPTANLFLGSGLFPLRRIEQAGVRTSLGTDIGAGTSFSMFRVMNEAYKIQQLQGESLGPFEMLYLATLGGARALDLEQEIGSFQAGREADFIILDYRATPLVEFRLSYCETLSETLFALITLGDDRLLQETWIMGNLCHDRDGHNKNGNEG